MKKVKILALFITSILLSSCVKAVNLQDRAIVQAVGVDYSNGQYAVTMQIFSPEGSGSQTLIDPTKQNAKIITCYGESISKAIEETSVSEGKRFFLGHNRLIVLGESTDKLSLYQVLAYFTDAMDSRADVKVLKTQKAYDILNTQINQGILPALTIEKTIENAFETSKITRTFLIDILKHDSLLIPKIETVENDDELKTVSLTGTALYEKGSYLTDFDLEETRGSLFLKDKVKSATYSVKTPDFSNISVNIYNSKTKNGRILAKASIIEKSLQSGGEYSEKALEIAENKIVKQISLQCKKAISKAKVYNSDLFLGLNDLDISVQIDRKGLSR